jgi:hypothetical protein
MTDRAPSCSGDRAAHIITRDDEAAGGPPKDAYVPVHDGSAGVTASPEAHGIAGCRCG